MTFIDLIVVKVFLKIQTHGMAIYLKVIDGILDDISSSVENICQTCNSGTFSSVVSSK